MKRTPSIEINHVINTSSAVHIRSSIPSVVKNDDDVCKVCYDQKIDCVFVPCGHIVVCMVIIA